MHSFLFFFTFSPILFQRLKLISRIVFFPSFLWFLFFLDTALGKDLMFLNTYFDSSLNVILAISFIVFGLGFLMLELQLVIEDYISNKRVRNVLLGILHIVSILGIYIGVSNIG